MAAEAPLWKGKLRADGSTISTYNNQVFGAGGGYEYLATHIYHYVYEQGTDRVYIEKIKGGWLDFDIAVATPDMMKDVGRLGMVLGRKGLMPNPKTGTVTADITAAINELKKGRVEFRADKTGVVHLAIGKVSMDTEKVAENITTLLTEIGRKKPADAKGDFIQSVSISSTMGPGVWIEYKVGE